MVAEKLVWYLNLVAHSKIGLPNSGEKNKLKNPL